MTNGRAIYGTTGNPFWPRRFPWGTVGARPGKLYLHVHGASIDCCSGLEGDGIALIDRDPCSEQ